MFYVRLARYNLVIRSPRSIFTFVYLLYACYLIAGKTRGKKAPENYKRKLQFLLFPSRKTFANHHKTEILERILIFGSSLSLLCSINIHYAISACGVDFVMRDSMNFSKKLNVTKLQSSSLHRRGVCHEADCAIKRIRGIYLEKSARLTF
jgi:hypothetical protein